MEQSPLVQQSRPDTLKPKIVELYEALFQEDRFLSQESEGFWREFFLLKPDPGSLQSIVADISTGDLLHNHEVASQQLFRRAIRHIRTSIPPSDSIALDTLTAFLEAVLNKTYTSPSSDIIAVLTGLQDVDSVFTEFVASLDDAIKDPDRSLEVRQKAVEVASTAVAGAYRTGLVSYFVNRDLFPSLLRFLNDLDSTPRGFSAFALLGLLTNCNKFEFQNPYRLRFEEYSNEVIMAKMFEYIGNASASSRDDYIGIQEDQPEGWNLGGTLSTISLGVFGSRSQSPANVMTEDDTNAALAALPHRRMVVLLPIYDFVNSNKMFCLKFVSSRPEGKLDTTPFGNLISFSSYLFQGAYRSSRASMYSCLCLLVFQILMEDQPAAKMLCSEDNKSAVRICRQRPPLLPVIRGDKVLVTAMIDSVIGGINHNLRKRLDVELYNLFLSVLLRIFSFLGRSRLRLTYQWSELWRSLISLLRFLTTYTADLAPLPLISTVTDTLLHLLALAISMGEAFLPDANSYDDLLYKIFAETQNTPETSSNLTPTTDSDAPLAAKLRQAYKIADRPAANAALDVITGVTAHYKALLDEQKGKRGGAGRGAKYLGADVVRNVIKQGYDTLDVRSREGLGVWERYREVDRMGLVKRFTRVAVGDIKALVAGRR